MTRKQIECKATSYALEIARERWPEDQDAWFADLAYLGSNRFDGIDVANAFEAGAEYALNSIWHKTEEEKPQHLQCVLGIYRGNPYLFWIRYDCYEEESADWWIDGEGVEVNPPDYWMAIPDSPIGKLTADRIF